LSVINLHRLNVDLLQLFKLYVDISVAFALHIGVCYKKIRIIYSVQTDHSVLTTHVDTHTHTHTCLTALFPGLPRWAGTRKVKPIWILLKQETVSGSGISWAICKSAPHSRQITTPAPHHSSFLQAGCPSCRPINSIKALKATNHAC